MDGCGFKLDNGLLTITSYQAILTVTATDDDGNVSECVLDLCGECPGDDDDDDDADITSNE